MKIQHYVVLRWVFFTMVAACLTLYLSALIDTDTLPYVLVIILGAAMVALLSDAQIGLFIGLSGAAAMVGVQRGNGEWATPYFGLHLLVAILVVLLCVSAGRLGSLLRTLVAVSEAVTGVEPAFGSMGLLREDTARRQIDGEIVRARLHDRPLSLLVIDLRVDPSISIEVRHAAQRAVTRLVESLLRPSDLPFAFSAHKFGVILPETDRQTSWRVCAPLVDAIAHTTVWVETVPGEGARERVRLADIATVRTVFTEVTEQVATSSDLITTALDALGGSAVSLWGAAKNGVV